MPGADAESRPYRLARHAGIGFTSSLVSDCVTNSFRVLKAIRQSEGISYRAAAASVVAESGVKGLAMRGLGTRLVCNSMQSILFVIVWKELEVRLAAADAKKQR